MELENKKYRENGDLYIELLYECCLVLPIYQYCILHKGEHGS